MVNWSTLKTPLIVITLIGSLVPLTAFSLFRNFKFVEKSSKRTI